jgi:hypothetical protein
MQGSFTQSWHRPPILYLLKKTRQSAEQLFASAGPSCKQNDGLALFET